MGMQPTCHLLICTDLFLKSVETSKNQPKEHLIVSKAVLFDVVFLMVPCDNKFTVWYLVYMYYFNSYDNTEVVWLSHLHKKNLKFRDV